MKKIISICLILSCLLFSVSVVNAEDENISGKQKEAISLMNDLEIFSDVSEENALNPVTRAEFAKIIVKITRGEGLSSPPQRIFTDVLPEDDAAASIEYLYNRGIMVGYENAEFKPNETISMGEALKVMVSVTGYSLQAEDQGGYPNGYYSIAVSNNLLNGISVGINEKITYADAAVIIQNVLESVNYRVNDYLISMGNSGTVAIQSDENNKKYMEYVLNIYTYTGVVEAYGDTSLYNSDDNYKSDACKIGGELFNVGDMDFSQYFGMKVKVYYRPDDGEYNVLHVTPDKNNDVIEVTADDISDKTNKTTFQYYSNDKLKKVNIADDAIYIYNGKKLDVVADGDLYVRNGSVKLISNDGGGKYNIIIIKEYETFIVEKALTTDSELKFKYDKGSLDLSDDSGIKAKYYLDGEEVDFSSISTGSVLSVAMSRNLSGDILAEICISNNQISGTAQNLIQDPERYSVILDDGTQYNFTDEYMRRIQDEDANTYEPKIGVLGTFYIDYFNQLAGYTLLTESKNYGYVVKCYYDENTEEGFIRIFTKEGDFETFTFANKIKVNDTFVKNSDIPNILKKSSGNDTVNQLIVYNASDDGYIKKIETAENKVDEVYYVASEDEFVLNAFPKNSSGEPAGIRFYKGMAENRPYSYVDGQTIQFMVPNDKSDEKSYKIATKLSSTDTSVPAPVYIYDAGAAGNIGAIVTNTANEGKFGTPGIVDKVINSVNEDGDIGKVIQFIGGTSVFVGENVIYSQPAKSDSKGTINWQSRIDYTNVTVDDLRRGDVIQYTVANDMLEMLRVIVKVDNIGPVRIDGDSIQLSGNMVADVVSVSENGRTALVYYVDRFGTEQYQTMLVNGTVYRYESDEDKVYNSSTADISEGDRVLINSYWWSPKLVVIFR